MATKISADYLVVGAGAMGMAFADTILSDTKATILIVDRYSRPGGHWTIAYPYVRLHQPSAFYGVNSRHLGRDGIDKVGWNKGLFELASSSEVCAYYDIVMQHTFLPSGRVQYFPRHEYLGEGQFRSVINGKVYEVGQQTRIVDATYMKVKVPSMGPPPYEVSQDVALVTPNDLPSISRPYGAYTVVGCGKTGTDACLWLLANGIDPSHISWIMPRDPWFLERSTIQPGKDFEKSTAGFLASVNGSIMTATSPEDFFVRLEACRGLIRLDDSIKPTMFRCSTVSLAEMDQIKKIGTIIRKGRVLRIDSGEVAMEDGTYKPALDTLYIDCSADALAKLAPVSVFSGRQITLQSVRYCQQVFSAAFIGHVEATYDDEAKKNELCRVIPHPDEAIDYLIVTLQSHRNGMRWSGEPKTAAWLAQARLDWFGTLAPPPPENPDEHPAFYANMKAAVEAICTKLEQLISLLPEKDAARAKAQLARF